MEFFHHAALFRQSCRLGAAPLTQSSASRVRGNALAKVPPPAVAQFSRTPADREQAETGRYIVDSKRQWSESAATGDTTAIERILADDFASVDPQGKLYGKAEMIAKHTDAPKYFVSNHLNEV